ncbi:MAG: hypothetical protein U9Q91_00200, partial [Candidatus Marinimicrobia bacterium]|nr:hypothetical protein [Candidatus Neomarinimicrobiota bacterium]
MADASSHLMVFGDSPGAASPGKIRLYFNSSGVLMQVDDTGTESSVTGGITVHNLLTGRGDLDCHTMAAITGLITALAGKEASFGDPTVDGMVLASLTNGTRYWKAIEIPHIFSAKNEIWQSFQSQSEVVTEWDVEILKHSKFT